MKVNPTKKTFVLKPADVKRRWVLIDGASAPLGRVATAIANRLSGKYQPTYTPHVDSGDYVIVINAANVQVTGKKHDQKMYHSYSGYPSGMKSTNLAWQLENNPERVIEQAVKGMLPKNKLSSQRLARLKVYTGSEHNHQPQQPETIGVER